MTAKRNNYDVTKRENGWAATRCGAGLASHIGSTQKRLRKELKRCIFVADDDVPVHV